MRSGWDEGAHSLIFDTGPLGCDISSGHGHADLLSIQCSAFGEPYLIDPGTGCYTGEVRDYFRSTVAHSTITVDRRSQAQPAGPFSWESKCTARLRKWSNTELFSFADADHDAYATLPSPVSHRRRVLFVKSRYWLVVDDLTGSGSHQIDVRFQFAPLHLDIDQNGWVRASRDTHRGLLMRAFSSQQLAAEVRSGQQTPMEGWISPDYGQIEPAPVVVYSARTQLPLRVVTLLWPTEQIADTPAVDVIRDGDGLPSAVLMADRLETITLQDPEPVIQ